MPNNKTNHHETFWTKLGKNFRKKRLGIAALWVISIFILAAIYAPFLASSKPLAVHYAGEWYFPLFRYLFFSGFFTKKIDLFFNLLIFTFPVLLAGWALFKAKPRWQTVVCIAVAGLQLIGFVLLIVFPIHDPASDLSLLKKKQLALKENLEKNPQFIPSWNFDLAYMNDYEKLSYVLKYQQRFMQHQVLKPYFRDYGEIAKRRWLDQAVRDKQTELQRKGQQIPTKDNLEALILQETDAASLEQVVAPPSLWEMDQELEKNQRNQLLKQLQNHPDDKVAQDRLHYLMDKQKWLKEQASLITFETMPLIRPYHWEDDAGGQQALNQYVPWWDLTRINRKDLVAALIFGTRISLVVGITSVVLAYLIGIPIGALAGYYGGNIDIVVCRLLEIWESMPVFFMLLMVVAITQSKSVFLVIAVIGIFAWTTFSRYVRGEFFKQRNLPYVEACKALGFSDRRIMFHHLLPNAIPPLLTLMPFAIMGAITTEAGLSFLGLGEEGSCSWGVLMDEGRTAFPGEAYLLWPPAILLTVLLVAIALVGDALRDALDPKLSN